MTEPGRIKSAAFNARIRSSTDHANSLSTHTTARRCVRVSRLHHVPPGVPLHVDRAQLPELPAARPFRTAIEIERLLDLVDRYARQRERP